MYQLGVDVKAAVAPLQIVKGGVPVKNTTFAFKVDRGYLEHGGSSKWFPDTFAGQASTDDRGVLQIAVPVTGGATAYSFAPFGRLLTVAPLSAPDQRFFDQKFYLFREPGVAVQKVDLEPAVATGQKPLVQMGVGGFPWIPLLLLGGAVAVGIWLFGSGKKERAAKMKTVPAMALMRRIKKSRRTRPSIKRRVTRRTARRTARRSKRSKDIRATLILRG